MWWARVQQVNDDYGTWVPTGQTELDEAKWYMLTYPAGVMPAYARRVIEWAFWR